MGGLGTLPPARSDAAGATPPTGSSAARRPASTVISVVAGAVRPVSAAPLPSAPVLRTPPLAAPALPGPALGLPAVLLPTVLVPAVPVVSARPTEPARVLPASQPAAEATTASSATVTEREDDPSSSSASNKTPAGHLGQQPISPAEAIAALPQQPSTPPAGHRPSTVPGLGFGGSGHHPLDSGLAPTDPSSQGVKPAGDCRGRDHTPPRERASAPSTSPD
ncbi:MAG: hypothetical protein ABIQ09_14985 [Jatrophihabitantaceae bacterium]